MEKPIQKVGALSKITRRPVLLILLCVCLIGAAIGFYHLTSRNITIVDAKEEIHIETRSKTIAQVLEEQDITLAPEDRVVPSLDSPIKEGSQIEIKRARPVNILVDGKEYEIITAASQVKDIIQEAGIALGSIDKVSPEKIMDREGAEDIQIVRVTQEHITDEERMEFAIQKKPTKELEKGVTKLVQRGAKGLKKSEIKITYEDGKEAKRETIKEEVVIEPKDEVIQVGMNDRVSTSRGSTRFEKAMVVTATAYSPSDPGVNNTTSVGAQLKKGVVAVDPKVIPYYTKLYVPGYGFGQALDTGGAIRGKRIDLAMGSRAEALKYGRRSVKIYLLGR